jgi:hypothetical protein
VELADAGRIFVAEARLAIFNAERALNLARADCQAVDSLVIGYSLDASTFALFTDAVERREEVRRY